MSDFQTIAAAKKNNPVSAGLLKLWSVRIKNLSGNQEGAFLDFFINNEKHHDRLKKIIDRYGELIRESPQNRYNFDYNQLEHDLWEQIRPYEPPVLTLQHDDSPECPFCGNRGGVDVLFFWDCEKHRRRPWLHEWIEKFGLPKTDQVSVQTQPCVCRHGDGLNQTRQFRYSQDKRRRIAEKCGHNPKSGEAHEMAKRCVQSYRERHGMPSPANTEVRTKMQVAMKQLIRDPRSGIVNPTD